MTARRWDGRVEGRTRAADLRAERARRAGLQIVWTLCHDGWPDDIDVCSDAFVDRFRAFAGAAARVLAPFAGPEPPLYTPINEISFLAWALAETALAAPTSRAAWLREIGDEIGKALERGVPIVATCVFRVVERPGWEDPRYRHGRRLWDVLLHATHHAPRVRASAYEQALRDVRSRIDPLVGSSLHGHPS